MKIFTKTLNIFLNSISQKNPFWLYQREESWYNTYDFCALSFKSPWQNPKASRKKGVEGQTKRATFPLGAIATSCLVPSSQGLSSGLLCFVWFLFRGPFLVTRLSTVGMGVCVCVWGGSPSFHSTWDPVDNPGPAHCIECAATISTVMPVNNAYSWNPLRWLLTVCGGGLEPRPGSFLDDCKWHQSLRTMEDCRGPAPADPGYSKRGRCRRPIYLFKYFIKDTNSNRMRIAQ